MPSHSSAIGAVVTNSTASFSTPSASMSDTIARSIARRLASRATLCTSVGAAWYVDVKDVRRTRNRLNRARSGSATCAMSPDERTSGPGYEDRAIEPAFEVHRGTLGDRCVVVTAPGAIVPVSASAAKIPMAVLVIV